MPAGLGAPLEGPQNMMPGQAEDVPWLTTLPDAAESSERHLTIGDRRLAANWSPPLEPSTSPCTVPPHSCAADELVALFGWKPRR